MMFPVRISHLIILIFICTVLLDCVGTNNTFFLTLCKLNIKRIKPSGQMSKRKRIFSSSTMILNLVVVSKIPRAFPWFTNYTDTAPCPRKLYCIKLIIFNILVQQSLIHKLQVRLGFLQVVLVSILTYMVMLWVWVWW